MMAGAILLLLGITKLGALIKFIPDPVIVGFTAGIGGDHLGRAMVAQQKPLSVFWLKRTPILGL
jgi:xanthine/uracil/vitamin C permease (AzgA family)